MVTKRAAVTKRERARRVVELRALAAATLGCLLAAGAALSQQGPPAGAVAAAQSVADDAVVATVDGEPIRYLDVKRQIVTALRGRPIPAEALPTVQAQTLEQVIYRRLISADFRRRGMTPTPAEEAKHDQVFAAELARLGISRDEYLQRNRQTDADLVEFRYWDLCWAKFLGEQLTDKRLQTYFDAHRREYDGTEVRVSHILFRVEGRGDQATNAFAVAKATAIRQDIVEGKILFAAAAQRYSAGPSREQGGDLGYIPRRERMVEEFSSAAFRLKKGEVSPPVVTSFGIHLITVTEERPGNLTLVDVRDQITPPAAAELYRETGRNFRKTAKVDYSGAIAHLDPVSERLVPAGAR